MILVNVPSGRISDMFNLFYKNSCFTFEGLDITNKESLNDLERFLCEHGYNIEEKDRYWYWFNGSDMNSFYKLTDDNAYPDDLTLVVIPEYYDPIVKLCIEARWFDDIVDNNAARQVKINRKKRRTK